ncbi:MAG: rod shape-determining protein [Betaproteobacteria bacterium AqS2]|uniref:Cell shape-determining protein MreB n=1 Tax=Candidatus Amphirhobacter heronislandensis TaxID=1732024 RepID=A0A930UBB6_9GAMM|nr:rod shape-determining protein [Betaproteobacteria bacterium AqS2]
MIDIFRRFFAVDMAIDLGTANTIIYVEGEGIVLNEPSVVAIERIGNRKVIRDIGIGAKEMIGRTPENIVAIKPMLDGVIADYQVTEQMLNAFIKRVHGSKLFTPGPRIIICVPYSSTPVERRAIRDSGIAAGATQVSLIAEPMAAAIGAELPVEEASGSLVVDIGGGTTEVGVVSLGGLVYANSIRVGGYKIDEAIRKYIRKKRGVEIGETSAEELKKNLAVAQIDPDAEPEEMKVAGHNIAEGIPQTLNVTSQEVHEAIADPLRQIIAAIREALQRTPPEIAADIAKSGVVLAGGGALIRNLSEKVATETKLPVRMADDPLTCVARGSGAALKYLNNVESIFFPVD